MSVETVPGARGMPTAEREAMMAALLARYPRIAIAGGPRTGKTTLTMDVRDRCVIHTDSYMELPWDEVPFAVLDACAGLDSFVVEGVQVPRVLRKGLLVNVALWLERPLEKRTPGQETMAKACWTVFRSWLVATGAMIEWDAAMLTATPARNG